MLKRTPIKRARLKRTRRKPHDPENQDYEEFLQEFPCCRCGRDTYGGVHHQQGAGMGLRSGHKDGMPMCYECHFLHLHGLCGSFKNFTKETRRQWEEDRIQEMNELWNLRQEVMVEKRRSLN